MTLSFLVIQKINISRKNLTSYLQIDSAKKTTHKYNQEFLSLRADMNIHFWL